MKDSRIAIRPASPDDAAQILAIYGPYIENTAITFEYEVPSVEEFRQRIGNIMSKFPYLVAVDQESGNIIGYTYANTFRSRKAYDWSVELSIYLAPHAKSNGTGRRLYTALEQILTMQNIKILVATITEPSGGDDTYTDNASVNFHKAMGFSLAGNIHRCGFKFGNWYDTVYMEKFLGPQASALDPVKPFFDVVSQINFEIL